jgi:zinc D-Ala-D-Ala carboxypeptidase
VTPDLLARLDTLRARVGRPLVVTSGLRCPYWNDRAGGERDSEHLTGEAADLVCGSGRERWQLLAANFAGPEPLFTRIGFGATFVHVGLSRILPRDVAWTYYATTRPA